MSTISAGTTSGTALVNTGDTTGTLVFKTNTNTTALTLNTSGAIGFGETPIYGNVGQVITSGGHNGVPTWGPGIPSVTGNNGKFLYTNGTSVTWNYAAFPPTAPTLLNAAALSATSIFVSYTQGQWGTENRIYYSTTSPVTTSSAYVVGGTSSGTITGLTANTTYYVAVSTYNSIDNLLSSQATVLLPPANTTVYNPGQILTINTSNATGTILAAPSCVSVKIEVGGAGGAGGGGWNQTGGAGGNGGVAVGLYDLSGGRCFVYYCGGTGSPGTRYDGSGGGGGSSAVVLFGSNTLIAVAGGGGGGGSGWNALAGVGGAGGSIVNVAGPTAIAGQGSQSVSGANGGGTSNPGSGVGGGANGSGRIGGQGSYYQFTNTATGGGGASGFGQGGAGFNPAPNYPVGGGGGGGYFGGGGGGVTYPSAYGGGGGSSYIGSGMSATTQSITTPAGGAGGAGSGGTGGTGTVGIIKMTFN